MGLLNSPVDRATTLACAAAMALVGACNPPDDDFRRGASRSEGSHNARPEHVEMMRADVETARHPSDGGGRAWIADDAEGWPETQAGTPGRWTLVYEAGPLGVQEGGGIYLMVPAFWGWSPPQEHAPQSPGFVTAKTDAEGVELEILRADSYLILIRVAGRALEPAERITMVYGAGPAGALADRFAERDSRFWIAVDGDGDGVRDLLADSPAVDVSAGPAARWQVSLPTTARPGDIVRLTIAALDAYGNAGCSVEGDIHLDFAPEVENAPRILRMGPTERGRRTIEMKVREAGVHRVRAHGPGGLSGESNPLVVEDAARRLLWGDFQIHSNFSDGTGTPEDIYTYARDVAALDVAALTDHDHWGTPFLDASPDMWREIRNQTRRFHEPGRFVTFLGYEWTNWVHGHRHVLYPGDAGEVLSALDRAYDTPALLWRALRGTGAITVAHHSAGEPVATNWSFAPDPEIETVAEIVSVHGSSEAADSPHPVRGARDGNWVRDALDLGYRLGFIGSGDGHDGHPGLAQLGARTGGLTGILSEDLTREGVLRAIREHRTYATSGPRIFLDARLGPFDMGAVVPAGDEVLPLTVRVVGTDDVARVDIVRSGQVVDSVTGAANGEVDFERPIGSLRSGDYLYVRVIQADGTMAWSSPFFVE